MQRTYNIPANYLDSGYVLNGRFPIRNGIEAVILGFAGYFICSLLPIPHFPESWDGITYYTLIILPLMMLGAVGIAGDPVSVFIMDAIRWRKERKPYFYNRNGCAFRISAAQLMIEEPSIKDALANKLDAMRRKIKGPAIEYVEGQNFQFAVDPELEALRDAEERMREEEREAREREEAERQAAAAAAAELAAKLAKEQEQKSSALDLDDIMENIVLHDISDGGETNG